MGSKKDRFFKLRRLLKEQMHPATVSQIHNVFLKDTDLKVSRKTIERDLNEMFSSKMVTVEQGPPLKYSMGKDDEIEIVLKIEEINFILQKICPLSDIFSKLKKHIE